jgi:5'-AMP-activated protein kinase catalytic alpha subunit
MVDGLFQTDPEKRINVQEIREHPFYSLHAPETPSFGLTRQLEDNTKISRKLLSQLEQKLGFGQQSIIKAINTNRHNHMTATYYLLLKKQYINEKKAYNESFMINNDNTKYTSVRSKLQNKENLIVED